MRPGGDPKTEPVTIAVIDRDSRGTLFHERRGEGGSVYSVMILRTSIAHRGAYHVDGAARRAATIKHERAGGRDRPTRFFCCPGRCCHGNTGLEGMVKFDIVKSYSDD